MRGVRDVLLGSGLFDPEHPEAIDALLPQVEARAFSPGDVIVTEGEEGDAAFVIFEGAVQVYHPSRAGDLVLARLEGGAHFGEQALLPGRGGRRNASVRAALPSTILRIGKEPFLRALSASQPHSEQLSALGKTQLRQNLAAQTTFFRSVNLDNLTLLDSDEVRFAPGTPLMRQGEPSDAVYVLLEGSVAVYQETDGRQELLTRMNAGQCVGELGLLYKAPRAATVLAEREVVAIRVEGQRFLDLLEESPELREYMRSLEGVYRLPRRGFVTLLEGSFQGMPCALTTYSLLDGRRFVVSRVIGQDIVNAQQVGVEDAHDREIVFEDSYSRCELRVDAEGHLTGFTTQGPWPELSDLVRLALERVALEPHLLDAFPEDGTLDDPTTLAPVEEDHIVCACLQVTESTLRGAMAEGCTTFQALQDRTSCGSVCGGCQPSITELLGGRAWSRARLSAAIDVATSIRTFRFALLKGTTVASRAGQHLVVQANIDGHPIQRPYTLTSIGGEDYYEITVKREDRGVFSRWLFDRAQEGVEVRVSEPKGEVWWEPDGSPTVCLIAGIGMTMGLAIARKHAQLDCKDPLFIEYCASTADQFAYLDELQRLARRPGVSLRIRQTRTEGRASRADLAGLDAQAPGATYYLCGPEPYLDAMSALLGDVGVPRERIIIEEFTAAGAPIEAEAEDAAAVPFDVLDLQAGKKKGLFSKALPAMAKGAWVALNAPTMDWRVFGRQLNPLKARSARDRDEADLDPGLPFDEGSLFGMFGAGPYRMQRARYAEFGPRYGVNKKLAREARAVGNPMPPDTPDGDTWAFTLPAVPLIKFEGDMAVDTGFTKLADGRRMAVYVVRGREALRAGLEDPERFDRGPIPVHFLQQVIGDATLHATDTEKPAGLLVGQLTGNTTWERDRELGLRMLSPGMIERLLRGMQGVLAQITAELERASIEDPDRSFDAGLLLNRLSFALILRACFGNIDLPVYEELGQVMRDDVAPLGGMVFQALQGDPAFGVACQAARAKLLTLAAKIVDDIRALEDAGELSATAKRAPLVQLILQREGRNRWSAQRLFPLLSPILFAGQDTTGVTLSWMLYELGLHPEYQRAAQAEIDAFYAELGDR
ncbi:MAG: cytochrome P450, partial [Alphaproteobacteria bacterium]|nr:cytochrome P450 [Alphaproteobacteria bacterium]